MSKQDYTRRGLERTLEVIQQSGLADDDKGKLTRFMRMLARKSIELSGPELQEARENAGLSRGQAAKLIGMSADDLLMIETMPLDVGIGLNPDVGRKMDWLYGIGRRFGDGE